LEPQTLNYCNFYRINRGILSKKNRRKVGKMAGEKRVSPPQGTRQSGKTTLLLHLHELLKDSKYLSRRSWAGCSQWLLPPTTLDKEMAQLFYQRKQNVCK
jgi:hypothetical protein